MLVLGVLALGVSACSTNPTKEQIGTGVGAAAGGAVGHVLTGGSALGTVGGAAAGALIGETGRARTQVTPLCGAQLRIVILAHRHAGTRAKAHEIMISDCFVFVDRSLDQQRANTTVMETL